LVTRGPPPRAITDIPQTHEIKPRLVVGQARQELAGAIFGLADAGITGGHD
jgi:hypothetical protein